MNDIKGRTKHGEISIDQLAEIQPGMARMMDEISKRFYYLYYAAKGGNWRLALHELNEIRNAMRIAKVTRPKYSEDLAAYDRDSLEPLTHSLQECNWEKFEELYKKAVEQSDIYHDKYGFSYVRYTLPKEEPSHMYLGPLALRAGNPTSFRGGMKASPPK